MPFEFPESIPDKTGRDLAKRLKRATTYRKDIRDRVIELVTFLRDPEDGLCSLGWISQYTGGEDIAFVEDLPEPRVGDWLYHLDMGDPANNTFLMPNGTTLRIGAKLPKTEDAVPVQLEDILEDVQVEVFFGANGLVITPKGKMVPTYVYVSTVGSQPQATETVLLMPAIED